MARYTWSEYKKKIGYTSGSKQSSASSQAMIKKLSSEGLKIITDANASKETNNHSYNQHDAYAYVVYHYGKLVAKGYLEGGELSTGTHRGWDKNGISAGTGREFADRAIDDIVPNPNVAYQLICLNGAFYSRILEDGKSYYTDKKFKILSQMATDMETIAKKYGGTLKQL